MYIHHFRLQIYFRNHDISPTLAVIRYMLDNDDPSSSSSAAIPFPTLTILYLPAEAKTVVEEVGQKYPNSTVEECIGFFHGMQRQYKKVTIWSQGIDSLWLNAVVARAKELAGVEFVTLVSGGIMYLL